MKIPQQVILTARKMIKEIRREIEEWPDREDIWGIQYSVHRDEEKEYWLVMEGFTINMDDEEEFKELLYRRIPA
jgi:hypothetical protein